MIANPRVSLPGGFPADIQAAQNNQLFSGLQKMGNAFGDVFDDAMKGSMASVQRQDEIERKKRENQKNYINAKDYFKSSEILLAQAQGGAAAGKPDAYVSQFPAQIVFSNLAQSLSDVSRQEFLVNNLIEKFTRGEVTEDEVVFETAKLNLIMSMVTTIVQTGVQTFKEILNTPV